MFIMNTGRLVTTFVYNFYLFLLYITLIFLSVLFYLSIGGSLKLRKLMYKIKTDEAVNRLISFL